MEIKISDEEKDKLLKEVMENYPEYSFCMQCLKYDYKKTVFVFGDPDNDKTYEVDMDKLRKGLDVFLGLVLRGEFVNGTERAMLDAGNWDSIDTDGLVQCAIFGEVIYG